MQAITYTRWCCAWRGEEARASELIEATVREASARGLAGSCRSRATPSSVLDNGLGRHDAARDAAWRVFESDLLGFGVLSCPSWPSGVQDR